LEGNWYEPVKNTARDGSDREEPKEANSKFRVVCFSGGENGMQRMRQRGGPEREKKKNEKKPGGGKSSEGVRGGLGHRVLAESG